MNIRQNEECDAQQGSSCSWRSSSKTQTKYALQSEECALMSGLSCCRQFWDWTKAIRLDVVYKQQALGSCLRVSIAGPKLYPTLFPQNRSQLQHSSLFTMKQRRLPCNAVKIPSKCALQMPRKYKMGEVLKRSSVKLPPFSVFIKH